MKQRYLLYTLTGLIFLALSLAGLDLYRFARLGNRQPATIIRIPPGSSLRAIAGSLAGRGLLSSSRRFIILARLQGNAGRLQAGEYRLPANASPLQIISLLSRGRQLEHRLTIPEGFTLNQIGARLAARGLCPQEEFARLVRDPALLKRWHIPGPSLEGYLFPSTYNYTRSSGIRKLLKRMVLTGERVFAELKARAPPPSLTRHQILTLASIIQKEAGNDEEMPLIASVFYNRLQRGMRLASDPTTIYALGAAFDGNLTRKDLRNPSPYNTYRHRGLPPGPICSPGRQAIAAALVPAKSEYLYFVSRNNGRHYFSRTLREHNRAVRRFQLGKRR